MVTKEQVMKELGKIIDPEIGVPITDMNLIDEVRVDANGGVYVNFHGSIPFCPMAAQIGMDIRDKVKGLPGVKKVRVEINSHVSTEEINKQINGEEDK